MRQARLAAARRAVAQAGTAGLLADQTADGEAVGADLGTEALTHRQPCLVEGLAAVEVGDQHLGGVIGTSVVRIM